MVEKAHIEEQVAIDFPQRFIDEVATPCYLISEDVIQRNCEQLAAVQRRTGAKILLALKAFALPAVFPLIRSYLPGICASGPIEARLGREDFGGEVHTYAPAYTATQMAEVIEVSDCIIFNSINQWQMHKQAIADSGKNIRVGLRVNPGYAEVEVELYNPCLPGSRFGVQPEDLEGVDLTGISGLHFHALFEQNADVLGRVLASFEQRFGSYLEAMQWVNFGGGHHITRRDYDVDFLCSLIDDFCSRHDGMEVFLEPGEAVVLDGGVYVTEVLDLIEGEQPIAIIDGSAETHLPDVLAMPYRPHIVGAGEAGEFDHTYRIGGISCLAGDIAGDYSFPKPLKIGDRLVFTDMALYSFVKNTTFNGVVLPSLYTCRRGDERVKDIRHFGFADYRERIA